MTESLSDIAFENFLRRMQRIPPEVLLRESHYGGTPPPSLRWGVSPESERTTRERDHHHHRRQPDRRP